jgi:hypothetical protein
MTSAKGVEPNDKDTRSPETNAPGDSGSPTNEAVKQDSEALREAPFSRTDTAKDEKAAHIKQSVQPAQPAFVPIPRGTFIWYMCPKKMFPRPAIILDGAGQKLRAIYGSSQIPPAWVKFELVICKSADRNASDR